MRNGLKIRWRKLREGSSPSARTKPFLIERARVNRCAIFSVNHSESGHESFAFSGKTHVVAQEMATGIGCIKDVEGAGGQADILQ